MKTITLKQAKELIDSIKSGHIFTVEFIKRTTGELRKLNCRKGVKKYLAGGEPAYNFSEKMLIPVFDLQKMDYRCFPLDALMKIRVDGEEYIVKHGEM